MRVPVLLLVAALAAPAWAGKLDDSSDAVHEGHDETSTSDDDDDSDSDAWSDLLGCGLDLCLPLLLEMIKDEGEGYFVRPPYRSSGQRLLLVYAPAPAAAAEDRIAAAALRSGAMPFAQWLSTSYAYDLAGVHRLALAGGLDTASRIGAQAEIVHYVEPQPDHFDKFLVGHGEVTLRLVQTPELVSRAALGVLLQLDGGDFAAGMQLAQDIEVYPWSPLVLTGRAELGWLGEALTLRARATAGVSVLGWELFAGYDLFGLNGAKTSVLLHGPLIGMRAWL